MTTIDFSDSLLQSIQKCISLRPVIVLGSGYSCKFGLPNMGELANKLVTTIPSDPQYKKELDEFNRLITAGNDLESALLAIKAPRELDNAIINATYDYINMIDSSVYDSIINNSVSNPLTILLTHLCRTANPGIEIVTTNYDRLAEYAIEKADLSYFTGFSGRYISQIVGFNSHMRDQIPIKLLKVHGSLDWFVDKANIPFSALNVNYKTHGFMPLIITPGTNKYEYSFSEPFRSIIAESDKAFDNAKSVLCIGYGFNDIHIHPRLIRRIQKDKIPITILTKKLTANAIAYINSADNKDVIGIEENGTGSRIRTSDKKHCDSKYPLWNLETLLGFIL